MRLPPPRGPLTDALWAELLAHPADNPLTVARRELRQSLAAAEDILYDDDLQLALYCLYELHYSGLDGVDERWEWDPRLLELRQEIEAALETRLRRGTREVLEDQDEVPRSAQEVADRLFAMAAAGGDPSVSQYVARRADLEQAREFLVHQSVYQLKAADPHTWAIPRLAGRPKAALVEIQADDYGGGQPGRMHSELFATTMRGLGLDTRIGAYVDRVPALALAAVNLMSLFGLHRRLRGAIVGHLALYEMTSSLPNASSARGFRRLGFAAPVTDYFDEHVEADAVHEQIAGRDLAGGLVEQDRVLAADVFFGAASAGLVDGLLGRWQLEAWNAGRSSLLRPLRPLPSPARTEPEGQPA